MACGKAPLQTNHPCFQATVTSLSLRMQQLKKDEVLRIPGNAGQGKAVKAGLNLIIFARHPTHPIGG